MSDTRIRLYTSLRCQLSAPVHSHWLASHSHWARLGLSQLPLQRHFQGADSFTRSGYTLTFHSLAAVNTLTFRSLAAVTINTDTVNVKLNALAGRVHHWAQFISVCVRRWQEGITGAKKAALLRMRAVIHKFSYTVQPLSYTAHCSALHGPQTEMCNRNKIKFSQWNMCWKSLWNAAANQNYPALSFCPLPPTQLSFYSVRVAYYEDYNIKAI
jgi:hypothetical protein